MNYLFRHTLTFASVTLLALSVVVSCAVDPAGNQPVTKGSEGSPESTASTSEQVTSCIPDGGVDDTLGVTTCCSGFAVNGSTVCTNPADFGTTWASCRQICGTAPVNGCIRSGGWDDTLSNTSCCSGRAVPGSTWCLNPADFGTTWRSCVQQCQ
jgi:hypothetical protein